MTCLVGQLASLALMYVNQWGMRLLPRPSIHWTMLAFCVSARRLPSHYPFLAPTHSPSLSDPTYTNGEEEGRSLCFRPSGHVSSLSLTLTRDIPHRVGWLVGSVAQIKHITGGGEQWRQWQGNRLTRSQSTSINVIQPYGWMDGMNGGGRRRSRASGGSGRSDSVIGIVVEISKQGCIKFQQDAT